MQTFFRLNKIKLLFLFIRTSVIFIVLVSGVILIAYFKNSLPTTPLLISIFATAGIFLPLFVLFIASLTWIYRHRKKANIFSQLSFKELDKMGFYKFEKYLHSKWHFNEEAWKGSLNGFNLAIDLSKENSQTIEVRAAANWKEISKADYKKLNRFFKEQNIRFGIGYLAKQYSTNHLKELSSDDFKSSITAFTKLLLQEGFQPQDLY